MNFPLTIAEDKVRVDEGPTTKTAIATPELLSNDVTAGHYQVGKRDAVGRVIVLGEEMTYRDWLGPKFYKVYRMVDGRWEIDSEHPTVEAAIQRGTALAGEMATE